MTFRRDIVSNAYAFVRPVVVSLVYCQCYGDTTSESNGSGTIIDVDGTVNVKVKDVGTLNGVVVKFDMVHGIAIVKIQSKKALPAATLEILRWTTCNKHVVGVNFWNTRNAEGLGFGFVVSIDTVYQIIKK
ncbi:unnamed protein product [Arabis nemorensis]|uniref:Uncharacterized protein n=1 Tax=Arabis nemorensis TaxID=586526 RepID=A0A565CMH7_9BRAS|nr:unnamed protein product [Arabis nemorensis]